MDRKFVILLLITSISLLINSYLVYTLNDNIYALINLNPFNSEDELIEWLRNDNTNELDLNTCKEYSLTLIQHGITDGYYIYYSESSILEFNNLSTYGYFKGEIINNSKYINFTNIHMHSYNSVYINNTQYIIEPQTDKILKKK